MTDKLCVAVVFSIAACERVHYGQYKVITLDLPSGFKMNAVFHLYAVSIFYWLSRVKLRTQRAFQFGDDKKELWSERF